MQVRPITCYDGWKAPAWFDYIDEQYEIEDIIDTAQMAQSTRILHKIIDGEATRLGGRPGSVVLLGYSQGGNQAYDVALSYPRPLAGLIARRTSLRGESTLGRHLTLPILHYHGDADDAIMVGRGKAGVAKLKAAGYSNARIYTEPGLGHVQFSAQEMMRYAGFLQSLFPQGYLKPGWVDPGPSKFASNPHRCL